MAGATKTALEADHVGMNKFESSEDSNYILVLSEIRNAVAMRGYFSEADSQALLKSLTFRGMDDREHLIATNHAKTFLWIWKHPKFCSWNQNISSVFWVIGKPGSGKSTLLKYVFNKLKKDSQSESPTSAVFAGFFFNDRGGGLVKSFQGFLQTILYQILPHVPGKYPDFIPVHKGQLAKSNDGCDWPLPTLRKLFLDIFTDASTPPIYIFIDALDECEVNPREKLSDEYSMLKLLEDICNIRGNPHRVFATSRYNERINTTMERINRTGGGRFDSIKLEELSRGDMKKYIASEVSRLPSFCQNMVQGELISRAQGVFLWVRLVIFDLLECAELSSTLTEIKEILDVIPDELDDLYTRLLGKVASKHLHKAEAMLRWVLFAERPLSLDEFRYATATCNYEQLSTIKGVEASMSHPQTNLKSNTVQIFSGGLLETSQATGSVLVQIIHQSAKEFLISRPRIIGGTEMRLTRSISNAYITDVCISYLKLFSGTRHVFYPYAAQYWTKHLHNTSSNRYLSTYDDTDLEEVDTETQRAIVNAQKFIFSKSAGPWIRYYRNRSHPVKIAYEEHWHLIIKNAIERKFEFDLPDFYVAVIEQAACFGHEEAVRDLLKDERCFDALRLQSDRYWGALYTAASKGYEGIVRLLLSHKANVNAHHGEWGNALLAAKVKGFEEVTQLLIESGANFRSQPNGTEYRKALYSTAYLGDPSITKFLIENGVDVNPQYCFTTLSVKSHNSLPKKHVSLQMASVLQNAIHKKATVDVVKILIDGGADVNAPAGIFGNAFSIAVNRGHAEILQLLIDNGADINIYAYKEALNTAVNDHNLNLVQVLVQNGGGVDTNHPWYGIILQQARAMSRNDIARFLAEKVAGITIQCGYHRSSLYAELYRSSEEIVQSLFGGGANLEPQGHHENALQMAAQLTHADIARSLFNESYNETNTHTGDKYGSIKINRGNRELVEILVKNGADISTNGCSCDGNILQQLIFLGHDDTMKFLVRKGAVVNVQGGHYCSPLHAAVQRGEVRIVQFLLKNGANIDAWNDYQGSALHVAVQKGSKELVEFLLQNGADINAPGSSIYGQVLQVGVCFHGEMVEFLIKSGADVNSHGGFYGNALKAAAAIGKLDIVQLLFESETLDHAADINSQGGFYGNALQAAATQSLEIVRYLMNRGAHINAQGGYFGSALQAAATQNLEIVHFLVENEADINAQGGYFGNALQAAATQDLRIVEYLLDRGAHIDAQGGYFGTALQAAAAVQNLEIVGCLLDRGANVNCEGGYFGTALQAAITTQNLRIVRCLLGHGADVDYKCGYFGTALQAAITTQNLGVVRCLLDHGAFPNEKGGYFGTALQAAITTTQNLEIVKCLVEYGAFPSDKGGYFGTALRVAIIAQNLGIVKCLLDHGADVNFKCGYFGTALQAAITTQNLGIVKCLVDHGADVNAQGSYHANVLQAAAATPSQNLEIVKCLVDYGADADYNAGYFGTALQVAITTQNLEIVKCLLGHGADVDYKCCYFGTALQAAITTQNLEIVKYLVGHGADVNAQGGYHGNALQAAAATQNLEIVKYLVDYGADVNAQGGYHGNALQAAAATQNLEIVKYLVDHGADVNAQGGYHVHALHAAIITQNMGIVKYLLDYGADGAVANAQGGYHGNALPAATESLITTLLQNRAKWEAENCDATRPCPRNAKSSL